MSRFISTALCALFLCSICSTVASASDNVPGKDIYDATCFVCHNTGFNNAPKLGDKTAWAPRIAANKLVENAINGLNSMPARGGDATLTDAQISDVVNYMAGQGK